MSQITPELQAEQFLVEREPHIDQRPDIVERSHIWTDPAAPARSPVAMRAQAPHGPALAIVRGVRIAPLLEQVVDLPIEVYSSKGISTSSRDTPVLSNAATATAATISGASDTRMLSQSSR